MRRATLHAAPLRLVLLTTCAALAPQAAFAQATQTGADISLSAEAVNNPYLSDEQGSWTGAGTAEFRPWLRHLDETDSITLRGVARVRGFTSDYDAETAFGADLSATTRLNTRTSAYGRASILTTNRRTPFDVLTARPGLSDPIVPDPDAVPIAEPIVLLPGEDITVLGVPGRITTTSVGAGVSHQIDPASSLGYNVSYSRLDGDEDSFGTGYQRASFGASYSRRLSPRTQVGLSGNASLIRYDESRPSATTFSLSATWAQQLDRYWSLSASAGVSSTEAEASGLFPGYSLVSPVASVSLCNQPVRRSFCFGYTRAQQPSFLGDVRISDSVSANYSEQLSQSRRIDFDAGYSRSQGNDESGILFPDVEVLSLRGALTQTINDRIEGYVSGSLSKRYGGFQSDDPSITLGIGVRLRLGTRR